MDRFFFIRSIVFLLISLAGFSANAQTVEFKLHVDNNGSQSGCEVNLANVGTTLDGIDVQVTAIIDRPSKTITGLSLAKCETGTFGSSVALAAGIPLGLNNGVNGTDVIELPVPLAKIWHAPQLLNLYFSIANLDTGAQDLAGVTGFGQEAIGTKFYVAYGIPTVGVVGLMITGVLLLGLGLLVLRRKQYLLAVSLLTMSSLCFAINFIADGSINDWSGHGVDTSDVAGDVSPPDPSADIQAVFLALESSTFFTRIDVTDLENVAPEANATSTSLLEDGTVNISLTGSDADGDPLSFAIVDAPVHGSLGAITVIDATSAAVVYTPDPDFNGQDEFTFKTNDSIADSVPASVDITVTAVNDEPQFTAGASHDVLEDAGAQSVSAWATAISAGPVNESGQVLSFNVSNDNNTLFAVQPGVNGAGDLSYTPADDANGASLVTIVVMDDGGIANGGDDTSDPQTFTITVNAVNDEPTITAGPDRNVNEDSGPQTFSGAAVVDSVGPADETGQSVSFNTGNDNNALFTTQPVVSAAGVLSFTTADNAHGSALVTIEAMDDGGTANGGDDTSVSSSFMIEVASVNDVPAFTAGVDQTVDQDSPAQTVSNWATGISTGPANESGQLVSFNVGNDNNALFSAQPAVDGAGTLSYTPAAGSFGSAVVTLAVMDDGGTANGGVDTSDPQTFTITVVPANRPPVLGNIGNQSIDELAPLIFTAVATDLDVPTQTLTFSLSGEPAGASITAGGSFSWAPTEAQGIPGPGGMYTFDVVVTDNGVPVFSDFETITVTVNEVNQSPLAVDDSYDSTGNVGISLAAGTGLITGDSDPDLPAQPLTFTPGTIATANGGSASISLDGSFSYTPPAGFIGQDTFSYTVNDNMAGSDTGLVTVTVADMIWFIDNGVVSSGDGTLATPFNTLSAFEAVNGNGGSADPTANQCIFMDGSAGTDYDGQVTLEDGQILIGSGASGSIAAECGVTLADDSFVLPSTGGIRPSINSTDSGISLALDNKVKGLNIGNTTLYGFAGITVGSPQISEVSILGTGPALGISTAGDVDGVTFDVLQCESSLVLPCINLGGINGTLGINSGGTGLSQTGTGNVVLVAGGNLNMTYPAAISQSGSAGAAVHVANAHTGTLTFSGAVGANDGSGLLFDNADGIYIFNSTVTLNGGDAGIDILSGSEGTFNFNAAASVISNPTGMAFRIDGSDATVTFPGSITKDNNANTAVSVVNNTGIVTFSGLIAANTGTADAFVVKGGGTLIATGVDNTITTTTGKAIEIDGTSIGVGGVTFKSVSVNGASSGIIVNNAGDGGFTITGDGSTVSSGGVISNISGRGIDVRLTDNISLAYMTLTDTAQTNGATGQCNGLVNTSCTAAVHLANVTTVSLDNMMVDRSNQIGINGSNVTDLTLNNSDVSNSGDGINEGALQFFGLTGTSSIKNSTLSFPSERVAYIRNASGVLDLTVDNSTFSDSQSSGTGADGLEVTASGDAAIDLTITDSSFLRNRTNGLQVLAEGTSAVAVSSAGSTFNRETGIGLGVDFSATGSALLDFDVTDSPLMNGRNSHAFNSYVAGSSTTRGRVDNNSDIQLGGGLTPGMGVRLNLNEAASAVYDVTNNAISNVGSDAGIQTVARGGTGRMDARVSGNTVTVDNAGSSVFNIWVQAQENNTLCANVINNSNLGFPALAVFRERTTTPGAVMLLQGFNTNATTTWANNGNTPFDVSESNNGTLSGGTCTDVPITGFPFE